MNLIERKAEIARKTSETDIALSLSIDGSGKCGIECPIGFLFHMLDAFCRHGLFDLSGSLAGDLHVDQHHLVEDAGIALGEAFAAALGNKAGIKRAGHFVFPMDESLCAAAVDFGGRPYAVINLELTGIPFVSAGGGALSSFQTDTIVDFWQGFASGARCNLHIDAIRGRSDHHKIEAAFKAAAKAIKEAASIEERALGAIPSTKGYI